MTSQRRAYGVIGYAAQKSQNVNHPNTSANSQRYRRGSKKASSVVKYTTMSRRNTKRGKVVTPADANPWPHEQKVAKILALAGHYVEFIPETNLKTPDIYLDDTIYEIKSPITNNPKKIIRNVKRALEKSPNVIIDSSRIKRLNDDAVQRTLRNKVKDLPGLKNLLFVNKRGQIIDIIALV